MGDVSEGRGGGGEGYFVPSQQEVQTSTLLYKALEIAIWLYGCLLPHRGFVRSWAVYGLHQGSARTGKGCVGLYQKCSLGPVSGFFGDPLS